MVSATSPPAGLIPSHLQLRFNQTFASRFHRYLSSQTTDEEIIFTLGTFLSQRATTTLHGNGGGAEDEIDLLALSLLVRLSQEEILPLQIIVDGIISYPLRSTSLNKVISTQLDKTPNLMDDLNNQVLLPLLSSLADTSSEACNIPSISFILLAHARVHPSLIEGLHRSSATLPSLQTSYSRLSSSSLPTNNVIQAKSHILLLLHTLLSSLPQTEREWKLVSLSDDDDVSLKRGRRPLVDQGLGEDYDLFFGGGKGEVGEETMGVLRELNAIGEGTVEVARTDEKTDEIRIAPLLALFPQIPPHLLLAALRHPSFSYGEQSDIEGLTNALLEGSLPSELRELQDATRIPAPSSASAKQETFGDGNAKRIKRDNIFDAMPMDFSKLKVGKDDGDIPSLTAGIPDHIRASILRLSEQQLEEEEEELRMEREDAAFRRSRAGKREEVTRVAGKSRAIAFDDEADEDEEVDEERVVERGLVADGDESDEGSDVLAKGIDGEVDDSDIDDDPETICEVAYLLDPKLFDRDGVTRRSKQRTDLKEQTGWSDEQLEGWRIMLEKNPRKDKILERHTFGTGTPAPNNHAPPPPPPPHQDGGGGGGRGSRGGGRGRGDGRGGGGNRGRGSKSSRGHQNAARTRGHDRKMQKMGAA